MYTTDRRHPDARHRLMPPTLWARHKKLHTNNTDKTKKAYTPI